MDWNIKKAKGPLKGELRVPADKSISHRAIMFGSIAKGRCTIRNFLFGEDCMRTLEAFRAMGTEITVSGDKVVVNGKGLKGLTPPEGDLYLGNSGTTMRIISGILAGQSFSTVLTGDESLSRRPMKRIIEPLSSMGAEIESVESTGCAPLKINGRQEPLSPVDYISPVASAQVKSCVLAAGLYAAGKTSITEPFQSRDHTERMLGYFGAPIKKNALVTEIEGGAELTARDLEIPSDISSAAFFIVAALITEGSHLILRNVGLNPTRVGIIDVLKRMGASINVLGKRDGVEPAGDLEVTYSQLTSASVEEEEVPLLIDEIPILAVAASRAQGTTIIKGIKELKVKETDRVKSLLENFSRMGLEAKEEENSLLIAGSSDEIKPAELESFGDHRIAMSMAIAALVSGEGCDIRDTACVDTSYPDFLEDLENVT